MTVGTVTVKLPKDLYARLDTLAKQESTDVVELRTAWLLRRRHRGRRLSHPQGGFLEAFLTGLLNWA